MAGWAVQKYAVIRDNVMIPESVEAKQKLTFNVPHILLCHEEQDGFLVLKVRLGKPVQTEFTTNVSYSETHVEEKPFVIKATNKINFGDGTIFVLNDSVKGEYPLGATSPTATEYMNKVGKRVMTGFSCSPDKATSEQLGKTVFRVVRSTIILP